MRLLFHDVFGLSSLMDKYERYFSSTRISCESFVSSDVGELNISYDIT